MNKVQKDYAWLRNKSNSAKTAIAQAEREVPQYMAKAAFCYNKNPGRILGQIHPQGGY